MSRCRYFIRAEPPDRLPDPELRQRIYDALSVRFATELNDYLWYSIDVTSIPSERWSPAVNAEIHHRIAETLNGVVPEWSTEFRIVPYANQDEPE